MGTPRETVRLEGDRAAPRMIATQSGRDWTELMTQFSARRLEDLRRGGIRGLILKARSPSCGPRTTRGRGAGLFARAAARSLPWLPLADEDSLRRPGALARFAARVTACDVWWSFVESGPSWPGLLALHRQRRRRLSRRHGRIRAVLDDGIEREAAVRAADLAEGTPSAAFLAWYGERFVTGYAPPQSMRQPMRQPMRQGARQGSRATKGSRG